jgi:hypothetical protein
LQTLNLNFGLAEKSWVDVYVDGAFKTFQIQARGSIAVEKGRPVLIRLRPNIREGLVDCPDLEEYIAKQPQARGKGKRAAEALVSPIKIAKVSKQSLGSNASKASRLGTTH